MKQSAPGSKKTIPAYEQWLFKNKTALASVRRGLKQSAAGKTKKLGWRTYIGFGSIILFGILSSCRQLPSIAAPLQTPPEKISVTETKPKTEIIGRWQFDKSMLFDEIMISSEDGNLYMDMKFKDGSRRKMAVVEHLSSLGRRFEAMERSSSGDYWIIDIAGNLQSRDNNGLILTGKKI